MCQINNQDDVQKMFKLTKLFSLCVIADKYLTLNKRINISKQNSF